MEPLRLAPERRAEVGVLGLELTDQRLEGGHAGRQRGAGGHAGVWVTKCGCANGALRFGREYRVKRWAHE